MYVSTKTYGAERGLSCCFRQWRADSHCRLTHGYALGFHFEFASLDLDARSWTVDFGGLKSLKGTLDDNFDHTMLVAEDDPEKDYLLGLEERGLAKVIMVPATGCESMARMVFEVAEQWIKDAGYGGRVKVMLVEVREHGANSAKYLNPEFLFGRNPWESNGYSQRTANAMLREHLAAGNHLSISEASDLRAAAALAGGVPVSAAFEAHSKRSEAEQPRAQRWPGHQA